MRYAVDGLLTNSWGFFKIPSLSPTGLVGPSTFRFSCGLVKSEGKVSGFIGGGKLG
jgi:hypothetical protein